MKLNSINTCPPGGFKFWVEETKQWVPNPMVRSTGHLAIGDLMNELRQHYNANRIEMPPNLQLLVEDQLCRNLPGGWCNESGVPVHDQHNPNWMLDFTRLRQGTETLLRWFVTSRKYVEQTEAERRAAICTSCPNNMTAVGCTSCNLPSIMAVINQIRSGRSTSRDAALNACSACGCSLKAKVWLPVDVLRKGTPEQQFSYFTSNCWMLPKNDIPNT